MCTNLQAVREPPRRHRQGPYRERGKLRAAAISHTLLPLTWKKESMKLELLGCCVWAAPSTTTPDLPMFKGARVSGNCLTMLKDLHTTLLNIRILCITNKCVKCVSQLVRDLGCCLRVHAHSVVLAFCYFYLNQICLLLISLLIHCGSGSFCLSSYMIKLCKTKWQKKILYAKCMHQGK